MNKVAREPSNYRLESMLAAGAAHNAEQGENWSEIVKIRYEVEASRLSRGL